MLFHQKSEPFGLEFFGHRFLRLEEGSGYEGNEVHGRAEGVVIKQSTEGTAVAEICRKAELSQATYLNWKKKRAGSMPSELRRLRESEDETGRLKWIVTDLTLDREMLQDVIKRKL